MKIYGYLIRYYDYTDELSHKTYGFVAASSLADATAKVENEFDFDPFSIEEIHIHNLQNEGEDNENILGEYDIAYFVNAARQNGFGDNRGD